MYRWWTCEAWNERSGGWLSQGIKVGPVTVHRWRDMDQWAWGVCLCGRWILHDSWLRRERTRAR
jgi:hypothetical protein